MYEEQKNHRSDMQKHIRQVASMLRQPAFQEWFAAQESRFDWATPAVFAHIHLYLVYQTENVELYKRQPIAMLNYIAEQLEAHADAFALADGATVTPEKAAFTFPEGGSIVEAAYNFYQDAPQFNEHAGRWVGGNHYFKAHTLTHGLRSVIEARMTLEHDTGHPQFEAILGTIEPEYMTRGYPYDLLAIDANEARKGSHCYCLALHKKWCSTRWITDHYLAKEYEKQGEHTLYPMNAHYRMSA